jgi:hypothetical protein
MAALCGATIICTRLLVHLVDGDLADSIEEDMDSSSRCRMELWILFRLHVL